MGIPRLVRLVAASRVRGVRQFVALTRPCTLRNLPDRAEDTRSTVPPNSGGAWFEPEPKLRVQDAGVVLLLTRPDFGGEYAKSKNGKPTDDVLRH